MAQANRNLRFSNGLVADGPVSSSHTRRGATLAVASGFAAVFAAGAVRFHVRVSARIAADSTGRRLRVSDGGLSVVGHGTETEMGWTLARLRPGFDRSIAGR